MLGRLCAVFAALAMLSGCTGPAAGAPRGALAAPSPTREPAESAGGACLLLSYDEVAGALGVDFGISAASSNGDTYTCVLRQLDNPLPDVALSVSPTLADTAVFTASVAPKGSATVTDLGKAGYSRALPASATGAGPGAEVGWLSGDQRLMTLRYRTPPGTPTADTLVPKLVALARAIDRASS